MQAVFTIAGRQVALDCVEEERRRLEDLARALEARLDGFASEPDIVRRLILAALSLLDETQTTNAALARARGEIERLTDMLVEARLAAETTLDTGARGCVGALRRVAEGAA
jgi:cell division protein ZapA (FtsZ GTPase activity inhibitor)